jgi:hypothetical protein
MEPYFEAKLSLFQVPMSTFFLLLFLVAFGFRNTYAKLISLTWLQGDQIGPIFDYWVIVYYGQFYENYRNSPHLWAKFFHHKSYA